jgi:hypothetical protein
MLTALALIVAACTGGDDSATPTTTSEATAPAPTTEPLDFASVKHAPVGGTNTTLEVALRPGDVTLRGRVIGPGGVVPGAIVEVRRLVGIGVTEKMTAGEDGTWLIEGVLGGRYRVRAWLAPDLTMLEPLFVFIEDDEVRDIDLTVTLENEPQAVAAVSPDPIPLGERISLVVQIHNRRVDGNGVVVSSPRAGAEVDLVPTGPWTVEGETSTIASGNGVATWVVVCTSDGDHPLSVVIDGEFTARLDIPRCGIPPTTTTETRPG